MPLFKTARPKKPAKKGGRDLIANEEHRVKSQQKKLENFIESEPARIRQQIEDERTSMPAPDDIIDRRREKIFYTQLTRGEIKNERRSQASGALLFILLLTAIAALSSWIYSVLQGI